MEELEIRRANQSDPHRIAEIHVRGWQESYAALMPAGALETLDVEERAASWAKMLAQPPSSERSSVFLIARKGQEPQGFAVCGRQRTERLTKAGFVGEFQGVYVLRALQGLGAGRRLMAAMARDLDERGIRSASVWVFRDNPGACRFYEKLGGVKTEQGVWNGFGVTLADVAYGWRDVGVLFEA
jgi:ribosomal protein S18 acetylase RimI-like enzyme